MIKGIAAFGVLVATQLLSACGGGGDEDPIGNPPVPDASPGGIWEGETSGGTQILGIVSEEGDFHFISLDEGIQYFGEVSTSENDLTGDFTGVTPINTAFLDGSTSGTGTITGTVDERNTLSGETDFTTTNDTNTVETFDLEYNESYDRNSSLARASGTYEQAGTGDIVTVSADGEIFLQEADSGCVVNGNVEIIDKRFNAYRVEYTYGSCTGDLAGLNGKTFRGLATLDDSVSPERMIVGATSSVGAAGISTVLVFERQ